MGPLDYAKVHIPARWPWWLTSIVVTAVIVTFLAALMVLAYLYGSMFPVGAGPLGLLTYMGGVG